MKWVNKLK